VVAMPLRNPRKSEVAGMAAAARGGQSQPVSTVGSTRKTLGH
jgi:hypothetical protein